ncbi:hypothetical protein HYFRA_00007119 [Hymenoscyphus fraxineus]|uniref:Uncharacterized protein n=1 Tax=Hymenoscyphus fraxineus TaxID=746836 RepID=A0A9N9KX54_9HELO|nr:hypothetical protein HYFRA_00007119 [Hymenoscyphus fraxineus]
MARPFPNTFDNDSPLSPPQSAGGGNAPISYRTNVNRQKTTKWTQAKAVDYGGDDWGSDDEYDLPPPQVIKKPTGLRQQGQGLPSQSQGNSPAIDYGRKAYGPLAGAPTASNPRGRTNSFGADEERSFSSTAIPQQSTTSGGPATRFSQITGLPSTRHASGPPALSVATQSPTTGLRKPSQSQVLPALAESPFPDIPGPLSEPASAATSQTPISDYQASRDFSPSAVPQPLSTRSSPAPSDPEAVRDRSQSTTTFPARKSSLSQSTGPPDLTNPMQSSQESAPPRPWTAGRSSSPAETPRTPGTPGKKLPFIRPADIYKRAEEERQSMESGRPSMDSIMGTRGNERGESPARLASRERTDSLGSRTRSSVDDEGSESGRRLMPMLDTVKERKSEYGFEGFNVNDHAEPANQGQTAHEPTQSSHLSEPSLEVLRSHSTSPKLPDLNRMSSFGMDMFSPSRTDDENPRKSETATPPPASEITLHSKPSIGLRSAVHQAFDRSDDSSVPPTPASRTGSGVRRTDSESTGTTGISPIMSRVPSTAIPNTQNRDFSTPVIPEAIDEPASPDRSKPRVPASETIPTTQSQPVVPGFKPGHRRDISAPSPGNSPARTPNVETTIISPPAHEVMITDASPTEQPRPLAEREQSFRPIIPGGWTSYATSTKGDSVEQEVPGGDVVKSDSVNEPYPTPHDDDHDLTPTSTRDTAQIPLDRDNSLPTPDPAMAPSGNLYSKAPLDPRLLPKLEQVPIESQLRPDVVHRALSAQSSAAPTPPPKDTPLQPAGSSSYFPHKDVTVNQKPGETLESSGQTQALPTLAADDEFSEDENDRLREEIVKTLTPRHSTIGVDISTLSAQPNEPTQTGLDRDSAYLPSEYDNYWQSSADDEKPVPAAVLSSKDDIVSKPSARPDPTPVMDEASRFIDSETPTIPPLKTRRVSQQLPESKPNTLQHRFSWEKSTETVPDMGSSATNTGPEPEQNKADHVAPAPALRHSDHSGLILDERPISDSTSHSSSAQDHHTGTDAALITGGAGTIAAAITTPPSHPDRRQSLADEKDHRVSPNNFTPTPPESDHSATSPGAQVSPAELHVSPTTAQFPPVGPHGGQHERLMAFKEIAALKSQQERTQTFNATRQRYAAMDSGLSTWIEAIQAQHPEHADAAGWGNTSRYSASGTSSARSKFAKVTGSGAPSTQQPYYQQYLNASSPTTPTASSSRPGLSTQSSGQQGFSPASAKLTTQQVQAKGKELGKELFHTAGIFGGKAGKAGKGLLAKGKSRFRGSGGGDKVE